MEALNAGLFSPQCRHVYSIQYSLVALNKRQFNLHDISIPMKNVLFCKSYHFTVLYLYGTFKCQNKYFLVV